MRPALPPVGEMLRRIGALLERDYRTIVRRERENSGQINLYSAGPYWAAFERSAYLLEQLRHDCSEPLVLQPRNIPFPLVMHNIHYSQVEEMCLRASASCRGADFLQFRAGRIDPDSYSRWYNSNVAKYRAGV